MLFNGRCVISNYTKDRTKKTAISSWQDQKAQIPCRIMKRESTLLSPDKSTSTVSIRVRIALPKTAVIYARDHITPIGEGRVYEVIDVFTPSSAITVSHKIAICKALGAPKTEES